MLPSKVVPLSDSVLLKLPTILDNLDNSAVSISGLYSVVMNVFRDINEFIFALDVLFVLNAIQITESGEVKTNAQVHTV